jgi:DNA-binding transcriptional MerR regulator
MILSRPSSNMSSTEETPDLAAAQGLIKIGDFAALAGTNLRTLRYYEEIGLLRPATRSGGGFRFYRPEDLNRLRMVASLQRLGLELARIRELMDTRGEGLTRQSFLTRVRAALDAQRKLIAARIAELETQRAGLEGALAKLSSCEACSHSPAPGNNFCNPCQVDSQPLPADLSALF